VGQNSVQDENAALNFREAGKSSILISSAGLRKLNIKEHNDKFYYEIKCYFV